MMKVIIEIEVNDDLEPCTYGCETHCPFGYVDIDNDVCVHMRRDVNYDFTCPVKEAVEKGNKDEQDREN